MGLNGEYNIGGNYDTATYIFGDFTASLDAAYEDVNRAATTNILEIPVGLTSLNDGSLIFKGLNPEYNLLSVNCLDKTYASLSKGTLENGVNAGSYMRTLGFNGGLIPTFAMTTFSKAFMNNSFTNEGAYSSLSKYANWSALNIPWAQNRVKSNYATSVVGKEV